MVPLSYISPNKIEIRLRAPFRVILDLDMCGNTECNSCRTKTVYTNRALYGSTSIASFVTANSGNHTRFKVTTERQTFYAALDAQLISPCSVMALFCRALSLGAIMEMALFEVLLLNWHSSVLCFVV